MLTVKPESRQNGSRKTDDHDAINISFADAELMKFWLHYAGPLPSSGKTPHHKEKMKIRRVMHSQLEELWRVNPVLPHIERVPFKVGNSEFLPLVTKNMDLVCALNVLLLRHEEPGDIIQHGGDIDNRLSTLFDSLQMPHTETEMAGEEICGHEQPMFCLLERDALITKETVEVDRLLDPLGSRAEVRLMIHVTVKATRLTSHNRYFAAYDTDT